MDTEKFITAFTMDFETGGLDCRKSACTQIAIHAVRLDTFEVIDKYVAYIKPYNRQDKGVDKKRVLRKKNDIDTQTSESEILAYTKFGGYEYFALHAQVKHPICTYVIDEDGLRNLIKKHSKKYIILTMYVKRDNVKVDKKRMDRDKGRKKMKEKDYDYVLNNKFTLEELDEKLKEVAEEIIKELK